MITKRIMLFHKADGPIVHYTVSAFSTSTTVKHDIKIKGVFGFDLCTNIYTLKTST